MRADPCTGVPSIQLRLALSCLVPPVHAARSAKRACTTAVAVERDYAQELLERAAPERRRPAADMPLPDEGDAPSYCPDLLHLTLTL